MLMTSASDILKKERYFVSDDWIKLFDELGFEFSLDPQFEHDFVLWSMNPSRLNPADGVPRP